ERQPRERDPVPHQRRRGHPPEVGQPEPAEVVVAEEVDVVVPVHEARAKGGEEGDEGDRRDEEEEEGTDPRRYDALLVPPTFSLAHGRRRSSEAAAAGSPRGA